MVGGVDPKLNSSIESELVVTQPPYKTHIIDVNLKDGFIK